MVKTARGLDQTGKHDPVIIYKIDMIKFQKFGAA